MIENTNEMDELLRGMGHELRTAVNQIVGYSEMVQEEAEERGATALIPDLQSIQLEGHNLLAMVQDTLDSARSGAPDSLKRLPQIVRVPLRAIMGHSEILKMDASSQGMDDLAEDLEKISVAAKKWLAYVNTDLDSAEIEDRKVPVPAGLSRGASQISKQTSKPSKSKSKAGNLLVVDDNEGNRDLLSRSLKRQGYSVETAADGEQALDMVKSADFDLVLLDVLMPGMNGLQVLERLKADETSQDIPVVVLSSLDDIEGVERSMELGAVDYIPKPINSRLLRARVAASLAKRMSREVS